jgi:two-component system, NtrC family, response regulator HydG
MFRTTNLLVVEDDESLVKVFERLARDRGWKCSVARSGEEALEQLGRQVFESAVLDIKLPGFSGMQLLEQMKHGGIGTEVIMMTGVSSVETAVQAIKQGAYDYLTKPFDDIGRVAMIIEKAMERYRLVRKLKSLERRGTDEASYEEIIGRSPKMQEIYDAIESIAPTTSSVLILGESGTGKELVAKALHARSKRSDKSFVVINCSAIPIHLLESELFGHAKGSFTGAVSDKKGLFEEADGGTLFLDEIGEIPPSIQVKLLRALQEGEIRAVGAMDVKHIDVRLIAATNQNLSEAVRDGSFREDLYYRINVINLVLPPLRERADDVPLLAYHFLKQFATKMKKKIDKISVDALQALQRYSWTGNVRELENVIERAVVLSVGDCVSAQDLPPKVLGESFYLAGDNDDADLTRLTYREAKNRAVNAFNKAYIATLLKETKGNVSFASERAGMDRSNFKKLVKKCAIDVGEFRNE